MPSRSIKFEQKFTAQEAAVFFRKLADNIEKGDSEPLQEFNVHLDEFKKLKIGIKRQNELVEMKAKVTFSAVKEEDSSESQVPGKMKYGNLKKLMDKNFKAIGKSLEAGVLPDPAIVQGFFEESKQMITYPGYGDEFYESYIAACDEFKRRFAAGVFEAINEQYGVLKAMKKECHSRYK
ncbi:MAG: GAK system XXXCH domain-containing protein [Desulfobulbaceae bacterium]|nr:GAK system XXXCH domain-containing protein [Desulfobulbaceae bacterium]